MEILGIYSDGKHPFVTPLSGDPHSKIKVERTPFAKNGDLVKVSVKQQARRKRRGRDERQFGRVLERMDMNEDAVDTLLVRNRYFLPNAFREKTTHQMAALPTVKDDMQDRKQVRGEFIVTVDSESAKDLDDAVSLKKSDGVYKLGVYIADVSRWVPKDSPADREALSRATSVYFGGQVVPMFPERLSNGLCSLNPGEEKAVLAISMDILPSGEVRHFRIFPATIIIDRRLSYSLVNRVLAEPSLDPEIAPHVKLMRELMGVLKKKRLREGSIDFDLHEVKITLDDEGHVKELLKVLRGDAERIIEEFMLEANRTVALFLARHKVPALYRVHDIPSELKVAALNGLIRHMGLGVINPSAMDPRQFQEVLERSKNDVNQQAIIFLVLRSMQQALYTTENRGHFGLGFEHYTHFTSPIRRYPDLITHRLVKNVLKYGSSHPAYNLDELENIAGHCTEREQQATEVERFYRKIKQVRFMKGRTKGVYAGIVTGVMPKGIFVELSDFPAEGLIFREDIGGDDWSYDERQALFIARRSRKTIGLGATLNVRVKNVDDVRFLIDFEMISAG